MSSTQQRRSLTAEEREHSLEVLASLLASTFDGHVSTVDVHRALRGGDASDSGDVDASWQVQMMECADKRNIGEASEEAHRGSQKWICPMCETVNWALEARKALRKRQEDFSLDLPLPVMLTLRCECCGYDGNIVPS
ncbi:hypothetical protein JKF63_05158 [Porcisia hertigi]|uniref:Uncharacterized protein n=1 Tax=Porcisia hertigi TaxID=2761500 RepID=A0A836LCX9_9TRYP|nr:hypothetical protein JKF63_05158 [Porcisia hertigi]